MAELSTTIIQLIRQQTLILPAKPLIVAVSGGTDSLALLHILYQAQDNLNIKLHVATLDHGLRGDEGTADADYVCQLAQSWGLLCHRRRVDVPQLAQDWQLGLETAARRARYAFLADIAQKIGAVQIATAHHADDQAETVLMRLLRGTGTNGLAGMAFASPLPGHPALTVIRPLLTTSRAEIHAYCTANGLNPRYDASNADTSLPRNYIRHEVLPFLTQSAPNLSKHLTQLAETAAIEADFMAQQLETQITPHRQREAQRTQLAREAFRSLHLALQRRCLHGEVSRLLPDAAQVQYKHIIAALRVALHGQVGAIVQFPGGVHLRVDYDALVIEMESAPETLKDPYLLHSGAKIDVKLDGATMISGVDWYLLAETTTPDESHAVLYVPFDAQVMLRTRQAGDRFAPLGMNGRQRKLKDWLIDRKVSRSIRDHLPLLTVNGTIAAILVRKRWYISETFSKKSSKTKLIYFYTQNS